MLIVLLAALAVLMITYGGFLFSFALHLQAGLGDSAFAREPDLRAVRAGVRGVRVLIFRPAEG
jgi:hypothetical protein